MARGEIVPTGPAMKPDIWQSNIQSINVPADTNRPSLTLGALVEMWWGESRRSGLTESTYESYRNTFKNFVTFLKHENATDVTFAEVVAFKNYRLSSPSTRTGKAVSAKTVKDGDLAALKAVFKWAVNNGLMADNPAAKVTMPNQKRTVLRSKGFRDDEAEAILIASSEHKRGGEHQKTFSAIRWVPWLCAFTGARVGEMCQLRKSDVFQQNGHWLVRITPEAGTVKTKEAREVPLHRQVLDTGFIDFVQASNDGHLFLNVNAERAPRGALRTCKNRLREFSRTIVSDPNVAPNHGWRHRFKTIGMEAEISTRVLDAIQGHAPRTAAENYGEVTLETMASAIAKIPAYRIA